MASYCEEENTNNESPAISSVSPTLNSSTMATSMASVAAAAAASRHWYSNKAEMIPFLSLCSRYPGGPWAGLLQQTMKEKQKGKNLRGLIRKSETVYILLKHGP